MIQEVNLRLKGLEDELNEDEDGDGTIRESKDRPGPLNIGDDMFNSGEEDAVNIGDLKKHADSQKDSDGVGGPEVTLNKVATEREVRGSSTVSKGSLKLNALRRSRDKKKFGNDPFGASGVNSSSKSPDAPAKKIKRKGPGGMDKESRDLIKNMESKIEDLRK